MPGAKDTIENVARAVAFIANHCALPIHVSCIRRLDPELFTVPIARICLLRAAQLLQQQQQHLSSTSDAKNNNRVDESPKVKLNQQQQQLCRFETEAKNSRVFGFLSRLSDADSAHNNLAITIKLVEIPPLRSEMNPPSQQQGKTPEVINLLTLAAGSGGGSTSSLTMFSQNEVDASSPSSASPSSSDVPAAISATLSGIWLSDRRAASSLFDDDDDAEQQQQQQQQQKELVSSLLSAAWRVDLRAVIINLLGDGLVRSIDEQRQVRSQLNRVTSHSTLPGTSGVTETRITRRISSSSREGSANSSAVASAPGSPEKNKSSTKGCPPPAAPAPVASTTLGWLPAFPHDAREYQPPLLSEMLSSGSSGEQTDSVAVPRRRARNV